MVFTYVVEFSKLLFYYIKKDNSGKSPDGPALSFSICFLFVCTALLLYCGLVFIVSNVYFFVFLKACQRFHSFSGMFCL